MRGKEEGNETDRIPSREERKKKKKGAQAVDTYISLGEREEKKGGSCLSPLP